MCLESEPTEDARLPLIYDFQVGSNPIEASATPGARWGRQPRRLPGRSFESHRAQGIDRTMCGPISRVTPTGRRFHIAIAGPNRGLRGL